MVGTTLHNGGEMVSQFEEAVAVAGDDVHGFVLGPVFSFAVRVTAYWPDIIEANGYWVKYAVAP
jgi:hypothetical protein